MNKKPVPSSVAATLALALVAVAAFTTARAQEGPAIVGVVETVSVGTPHPYQTGTGANSWQHTFHYPGATYLRVHFSQFDLAPGDSLTITDAYTGVSSTYTGRGPFSSGSFWAFTVFSDTAIVTLDAPTGGGPGLEMDTVGVGNVPMGESANPSPQDVCGSDTPDWQNARCYQLSAPIEYQRSLAVARIMIGGDGHCTAFKVSDSGQFMTNQHCFGPVFDARNTEVLLNYEFSSCSGTGLAFSGRVMGNQILKMDDTLDYALFNTIGDSNTASCLRLDARLAPVGERIYLAGHPNAEPKKLTIASDLDSDGFCHVNASPYDGLAPGSDLGYQCDTLPGASGSPVLSGSSHTVVALHHFGACDAPGYLNSGVRMDLICRQIGGLLGTCGGQCGPVDVDADGRGDCCDNCWSIPNSSQIDLDNDRLGDACDLCPLDPLNDIDADGLCGNVDNCPMDYNPNQLDTDGDGMGDGCDNCPLGACPSPPSTSNPLPGGEGPHPKKIAPE